MIGNVVSRRYASALFALGKEAGLAEMERYGQTLDSLGQAMHESAKLVDVFKNPVLRSEEKKSVVVRLIDLAGGKEVERRFCELLADKGRLNILPAIAADYGQLLDAARGVSRGTVTTALALDKAAQDAITKSLEAKAARTLELEFAVDEKILGGLVLKIGDQVLDASLGAQLENLKESIKRGE